MEVPRSYAPSVVGTSELANLAVVVIVSPVALSPRVVLPRMESAPEN